jgi:hypothetical protein
MASFALLVVLIHGHVVFPPPENRILAAQLVTTYFADLTTPVHVECR